MNLLLTYCFEIQIVEKVAFNWIRRIVNKFHTTHTRVRSSPRNWNYIDFVAKYETRMCVSRIFDYITRLWQSSQYVANMFIHLTSVWEKFSKNICISTHICPDTYLQSKRLPTVIRTTTRHFVDPSNSNHLGVAFIQPNVYSAFLKLRNGVLLFHPLSINYQDDLHQ